jgi:hypothetical protein
MAPKFLRAKKFNNLVQFSVRFRLFEPTALGIFLARPSDEIRSNRLGNSTAGAASRLNIEMPSHWFFYFALE